MAAMLASACLAGQGESDVRQALAKAYPGVKAGEIRSSDISGLYEIEAGPNIIYFYPEKDLLVFGEIWSKDGRNVTAEKNAQIGAARLKDVPLDKAVKIGNGR